MTKSAPTHSCPSPTPTVFALLLPKAIAIRLLSRIDFRNSDTMLVDHLIISVSVRLPLHSFLLSPGSPLLLSGLLPDLRGESPFDRFHSFSRDIVGPAIPWVFRYPAVSQSPGEIRAKLEVRPRRRHETAPSCCPAKPHFPSMLDDVARPIAAILSGVAFASAASRNSCNATSGRSRSSRTSNSSRRPRREPFAECRPARCRELREPQPPDPG